MTGKDGEKATLQLPLAAQSKIRKLTLGEKEREGSERECSGLNENDPHRRLYLECFLSAGSGAD